MWQRNKHSKPLHRTLDDSPGLHIQYNTIQYVGYVLAHTIQYNTIRGVCAGAWCREPGAGGTVNCHNVSQNLTQSPIFASYAVRMAQPRRWKDRPPAPGRALSSGSPAAVACAAVNTGRPHPPDSPAWRIRNPAAAGAVPIRWTTRLLEFPARPLTCVGMRERA